MGVEHGIEIAEDRPVAEEHGAGGAGLAGLEPTFFLTGQPVDPSQGLAKVGDALDVVLRALGRQDGTAGGVEAV